jgi:hypothetical protein
MIVKGGVCTAGCGERESVLCTVTSVHSAYYSRASEIMARRGDDSCGHCDSEVPQRTRGGGEKAYTSMDTRTYGSNGLRLCCFVFIELRNWRLQGFGVSIEGRREKPNRNIILPGPALTQPGRMAGSDIFWLGL